LREKNHHRIFLELPGIYVRGCSRRFNTPLEMRKIVGFCKSLGQIPDGAHIVPTIARTTSIRPVTTLLERAQRRDGRVKAGVARMPQQLNSVFCGLTWCKDIRASSDCKPYMHSVCTESVCGAHLSSVNLVSATSAAMSRGPRCRVERERTFSLSKYLRLVYIYIYFCNWREFTFVAVREEAHLRNA